VQMFLDYVSTGAVQPDEELLELFFELPGNSPDPPRSLFTLIDDLEHQLSGPGPVLYTKGASVEVFEMEAPPPHKDLKGIAHKKKYKKVANRVRPVEAETPPEFRIVRKITGDPLADLPTLSTNPPDFTPGVRYTEA